MNTREEGPETDSSTHFDHPPRGFKGKRLLILSTPLLERKLAVCVEKHEHWASTDTTHGHSLEMCHRLQYKMKRM